MFIYLFEGLKRLEKKNVVNLNWLDICDEKYYDYAMMSGFLTLPNISQVLSS